MTNNVKVPDEVAKVIQKLAFTTDSKGNFLFPLFNDGIIILLAVQQFARTFDGAKRDPKTLKEYQRYILKEIERMKRNKIIPANAKKIRDEIVDE